MGFNSLKLRSKFYLSFGAVLMVGTLVAALMLIMLIRSSSSYGDGPAGGRAGAHHPYR
jgi:hypothetical protein